MINTDFMNGFDTASLAGDDMSDTFFGAGDEEVTLEGILQLLADCAAMQTPAPPQSQPKSGKPSCTANLHGNPIPGDVRYRDEICAAAKSHGLDPMLLAAVAAQETGGPGSNSGRNIAGYDGTGHGVFQIDSGSWQRWLSSHHNGMNVAENADKAATILSDNLRATGGDVRRALHRYNAGSDGVPSTRTNWAPGVSLDYETSVMRHIVDLNKA